MHPVRKKRLYLVLAVVLGASATVGLAAYALRNNINLFYLPAEIAEGKAPQGRALRAGGMVVQGSFKREPGSLDAHFKITDYTAEVNVIYSGILPDMFKEGQGVVAAGTLDDKGTLIASEVLAKHDENYMPKEVKDALEKSGRSYGNKPSKLMPTSLPKAPL